MAETRPYVFNLEPKYEALELVDVPAVVAACRGDWTNQALCRVNESLVRVAVVQGEFHWHHHDREDELFYVVEGRLLVDLEGRTVELAAGHGFTVPKGVEHRTRAPQRTAVLIVSKEGALPAGN
ncbi:MAG: cupin domain-containing protein [Acidobacteria bacterium]|nr:cupin domain-containing protein [Acidobacteriota bacterium]